MYRVKSLIRFHSVIKNITKSTRLSTKSRKAYGKQKETHELIFSWLSWLAVLLVARTHDDDDGGVAQDGCHTPNNRLTETCSLGLLCTSLILDIHG